VRGDVRISLLKPSISSMKATRNTGRLGGAEILPRNGQARTAADAVWHGAWCARARLSAPSGVARSLQTLLTELAVSPPGAEMYLVCSSRSHLRK
jgi:hypothetical protein